MWTNLSEYNCFLLMKNNKINMCYYAHLYGIAYSVSIMWYEMGYSVIYR